MKGGNHGGKEMLHNFTHFAIQLHISDMNVCFT